MLVVKSGPRGDATKVILDGVDITAKLNLLQIDIDPLTPNAPVRARFTVLLDSLEVAVAEKTSDLQQQVDDGAEDRTV